MSKEVRATDPTTGGQKGRKEQELSLLPWRSIWAISEVYHYGAQKYAAHNWRKGYPWSWSFDALQRHLTAWWEGESRDPESGYSHLAHAGFHILSLLWFELTGRGKDDRWKPENVAGDLAVQREVSPPSPSSDTVTVVGSSGMVYTHKRSQGLEHTD